MNINGPGPSQAKCKAALQRPLRSDVVSSAISRHQLTAVEEEAMSELTEKPV